MTREEIKSIDHFAYPTPFTNQLGAMGLIPYRANDTLKEKIRYIFSHPKFKWRDTFIWISEHGSKRIVDDMAIRAIAMMRHFMLYPQQYGHRVENIQMQILVRMWRQVYRHKKFQKIPRDKYMATKMRLLLIENGWIEELIRTVDEKDYIQSGDDMVKVREGVGLRERKTSKTPSEFNCDMIDGDPIFEELCKLE